jgi:hypothetical protein
MLQRGSPWLLPAVGHRLPDCAVPAMHALGRDTGCWWAGPLGCVLLPATCMHPLIPKQQPCPSPQGHTFHGVAAVPLPTLLPLLQM